MRTLRTSIPLLTALAATIGLCGTALAQVDRYSDAQLNQLQASAIGRGYSVDSMNSNTLNRVRTNVGLPGVGNGGITGSSLGSSPAMPARRAAQFDSFGAASGPRNKAFSTVQSDPVISPYYNLFYDPDGLGGDVVANYNSLVRPQLQQNAFNQQVRQQAQFLNRRVQELSAKPAFDPRGSQSQAPTGHSTGFMYYSHFYPGFYQQQPRR